MKDLITTEHIIPKNKTATNIRIDYSRADVHFINFLFTVELQFRAENSLLTNRIKISTFCSFTELTFQLKIINCPAIANALSVAGNYEKLWENTKKLYCFRDTFVQFFSYLDINARPSKLNSFGQKSAFLYSQAASISFLCNTTNYCNPYNHFYYFISEDL